MNNIFTKLKDFVGFGEPQDYEEYEEEVETAPSYQNLYQQEHPPVAQEETLPRRRNRERLNIANDGGLGGSTMNNVIGMPGLANGTSEVVVIEPRSFEEMPEVIRSLRDRKAVVLNLTLMDPDQAQRSVDFVAGGTYAIDGYQERIGESIFLFTPSCVQVSTQSGTIQDLPSPQAPSMPQVRVSRAVPPNPWGESTRMAQ
ncbi:MAG: cell division protein SepF [Coleofasciculaceae cyanobacterium SM2_1_6]|nr:cell division protein SepF [Coleofasciculaceae cyanobacterium SM2_1_6]